MGWKIRHAAAPVARWATLLMALILAAQGAPSHAAENVQLATYYRHAPWQLAGQPGAGLNAELAAHLNRLAGGRYHFSAVYVPRKRLDVLLRHPQGLLVVAWAHPRFFQDLDHTRYLWSQPLMQDQSLVVSPREAPLHYAGPASLRGKRFGAPAGHVFPDLDPLVASGAITRIDVPQVKNALSMMVNHRHLDFTIVDRSDLEGLKGDPLVDQARLHVAAMPRTAAYERCILVPKNQPALHRFLNQALARLPAPRAVRAGTPVLRC